MNVHSSASARLGEPPVSAKTTTRPRSRIAETHPRLLDAAVLAAMVIAATCLYSVYAMKVGSFQPDEWYYMELARVIANHFPSGLWQQGIYWRGIQRLDQLVLAAPFAFLRGASVYQTAHVIQALLFASTAIPVWLLARGAGLGRWACALASSIALVVPWAVVSTSFLAESAAYPAYAWVLCATCWTARKPSRRGELLAILALAIAALSRTALLAMAPILPLTLIWQQWRLPLRGRKWPARLRALPGRMLSAHPIVTVITVVAVAVFVISEAGLLPGRGLAALTGNYGIPNHQALTGLLNRYEYYLSRIIVGTGWIAGVLGVAWALRELIRPGQAERHALAVVCTLGVGVILLSLLQAGPDERYVLYGAVPVGLAFAAELDLQWHTKGTLSRAALLARLAAIAVAAAIVIVIFARAGWSTATTEYDFFTYPAATFYARVALTRLTTLPSALTPSLVVSLVIALVALTWVLIGAMGRARRLAVVAMAVAVLGICATELIYTLDKFTSAPATAADGTNASQRSWLEGALPAGTRVAAVGIGLGQTAEYVPIWRTSEFWNTAIGLGVSFQPWGVPTLPFEAVSELIGAQSPSGRLTVGPLAPSGPVEPISRYLLLPRQASNPDGFAAQVVAQDPVLPLTLVRLREPERLEWALLGISPEGFLTSGQPGTATVFEDALHHGPQCASFSLVAPATYTGPTFSGSWPYLISSGPHEVVKGRLHGGQTRTIHVRLHPARVSGGRDATITMRIKGQVKYVNGAIVSARVVDFSLGACHTR